MKPAGKLDLVSKLQLQGWIVAMAGDGINDAPAPAKANVDFAMRTGIDVAMSSAQVTLINANLRGISLARFLSDKTIVHMKQTSALHSSATPLACHGQ